MITTWKLVQGTLSGSECEGEGMQLQAKAGNGKRWQGEGMQLQAKAVNGKRRQGEVKEKVRRR
jgi:hypothetical protein